MAHIKNLQKIMTLNIQSIRYDANFKKCLLFTNKIHRDRVV